MPTLKLALLRKFVCLADEQTNIFAKQRVFLSAKSFNFSNNANIKYKLFC